MTEELIRVEHVSKFYGRVQALDDVSRHHQPQRDRGPPGRQRRRQVHAHQDALRGVPLTSGAVYINGQKVSIQSTERRHRARHRDHLPGLGAGEPALHRAQPLPGSRAAQGTPPPEPHGQGLHGRRGPAPHARGGHHEGHPAQHGSAAPLRRRAPGGGHRAGHVLRVASSSSSTSRPTTWAWRRPRACCASCATRATRGTPASSSPTTSITSSRWWTASSCCAAARSWPTTSTPGRRPSRPVERVITGEIRRSTATSRCPSKRPPAALVAAEAQPLQ